MEDVEFWIQITKVVIMIGAGMLGIIAFFVGIRMLNSIRWQLLARGKELRQIITLLEDLKNKKQ